jgi:hypothetical protein
LTAANEKNVEVRLKRMRCSIIIEIHLLQNDSDSDLMEVESFTSVQGTSTPSPSPSSVLCPSPCPSSIPSPTPPFSSQTPLSSSGDFVASLSQKVSLMTS